MKVIQEIKQPLGPKLPLPLFFDILFLSYIAQLDLSILARSTGVLNYK